ncbi:MAG: class I SAM-dependent methyltransferase [Planctomycetales bacterium]
MNDYVLGDDALAARRLEIQDAQFAEASERLLDDLALSPDDQVVEIGVGAGGFSRRILRRLGPGGVLRGIDFTAGLLDQARARLADCGPARFEPVLANALEPGSWLEGADVVVGRNVVHHFPLAESWIGRLRAALRPSTRVGFIEPEFRALLGRMVLLEQAGRTEVRVLRGWAEGISRFYQASGVSPAVGATLGWAFRAAGFQNVRADSSEHPTDATVLENMLLYYDEIRDIYQRMGIMTAAEIDQQQELIRALPGEGLPAIWGIHRVTAVS